MYEIVVSGYGGGNSASIKSFRISEDWTEVEEIWSDNIESPSFLSLYKDMLFAITEKEKSGAVFCYKKDTKGYRLMDRLDVDGGDLCHISYSPKNKTLYGACYGTGHVLAVSVEGFKFSGLKNSFIINPDSNKDITRAHCCVPDNDENRAFVCNIALDRVYIYNIENGILRENKKYPYIQLQKGDGPRHIRFHPKLDIAYVITEYSNEIIVLSYQNKSGELNIIQKVTTLPAEFNKKSYCSTLAISADGNYLYAANRGANTISVFNINKDGLVQKIQDFDCYGNWPRHIDLTADGRFLMAANQRSGNIAVISISKADGRLEKIVYSIPFKTPSYLADIK